MKSNGFALILVGMAWPFLGLGFTVLHFRHIPDAAEAASIVIGLFLAGVASGAFFLMFRAGLPTTFTRALLVLGYLLFAPLGLMAGLLAPATLAGAGTAESAGWFSATIFVALYASLAMGPGLMIMSGLGLAVQAFHNWRTAPEELVPVPVRVRN